MFSKALVCFLIVLAGCGSATSTHQRSLPLPTPTGEIAKPATEILADARRELLAAGSVRVRGTVSQSVAAKTSVQQRLDLRVGRGPGGEAEASGTITTIASLRGARP